MTNYNIKEIAHKIKLYIKSNKKVYTILKIFAIKRKIKYANKKTSFVSKDTRHAETRLHITS